MTRRTGSTYRIHDAGPFTVAFGGNWVCDGSHRWPKVDLIFRDRWSRSNGRGGRATIYRRLSLPLPYIRWSTAYQHPVLKPIHQRIDRLYRRWFITRQVVR